jgi:Ser/Thr protein kinase RdoA (MazF antagonist)
MSSALSDEDVARLLARQWGIVGASLAAHHLGMNSQTWFVSIDGAVRGVAKAVPDRSARQFDAALAVAERVESKGIPAGAPMPTREGSRIVVRQGCALGLLRFVPGAGLSGDDANEQRIIGATLAGVHSALAGFEVPGADRFHWLDPDAAYLDIRPWLRPAITAALATWERIPPRSLTWGLLHGDPAPEAFLLDATTGACGLIDWGAAFVGPLLYDVASAVMYVDGPEHASELLDSYATEGDMDRSELEHGLLPMLTLRWAVQADYFARRIATDDLTGIGGPAENEKGLADAESELAELLPAR